MDLLEQRTAQIKDKRVLIIGALGFIGRNLAARLLEAGAEVTMVDKAGADARELARVSGDSDGSLQLLQADVQDSKSAESYLQGQEIVFNLAGHSGPLGSIEEPSTNLEVNCRGALTLLDTIRRVSPSARVVFPSSRLVYGRPERLPVDERNPHP